VKRKSKRLPVPKTASPVLDAWAHISQLQNEGFDVWSALGPLNDAPPKTPPESPAKISGGVPIISREEIDGMTPSRVAEYFYDRILTAAEQGDLEWEGISARLRAMPQHWRLVYTLCWLQAEVDNGGHEQFFTNGRGELDDETEADLRFIGAGRFLELFKGARLFYDSAPADRADRIPQIEPLDDAFYQQKKSLHTLVGEYVLSHLPSYRLE
jgi:hypothetical protein